MNAASLVCLFACPCVSPAGVCGRQVSWRGGRARCEQPGGRTQACSRSEGLKVITIRWLEVQRESVYPCRENGGSRCPLIRGNVTDKIWSARGTAASCSTAAVARGDAGGAGVCVCETVCVTIPTGHRHTSQTCQEPSAGQRGALRRERLFTAQCNSTH